MGGMLEGKVVVITGMSTGVGRASMFAFTRAGAKVLGVDIDLPGAEKVVDDVLKEGGTAAALKCNVTSETDVEAAVAEAVKRWGRLDIIYCNAGVTTPYGTPRTFVEQSNEEWRRLQGINVEGVMNGCRAATKQFRKQGGGGSIVITASVVGLIGWGNVLYGSTKGAVTTLVRGLALELAKENIRVNSVCPAGMLTAFGVGKDVVHSNEMVKMTGDIHPLKRPIDPMDVAHAAAFLASDLANNITGVNLPVDGGMTAGHET
jgi:NAD(P)-dependent dehydrogenase (short-subunit alcohol dehydrogenase family)